MSVCSNAELAQKLSLPETKLMGISYSYRKILRMKKDDGVRTIYAPSDELKNVQRCILDKILIYEKLPDCVYGIGKDKGIIENAQKHVQGAYLLNLDIQNFFPSVHWKRVEQIYKEIGCADEVGRTLCRFSTLNHGLPQGAPTSPYLANLALHNLDYRLYSLCKKNRLTYTRYFDDISVSGNIRVKTLEKTFIQIISEEGYKTKPSKRKLFGPEQNKEITGILISDGRLSIVKEGEIRKYIIALKQNGFGALASDNIEKEKRSLLGKIMFLKQVNPAQATTMEKLFQEIEW